MYIIVIQLMFMCADGNPMKRELTFKREDLTQARLAYEEWSDKANQDFVEYKDEVMCVLQQVKPGKRKVEKK